MQQLHRVQKRKNDDTIVGIKAWSLNFIFLGFSPVWLSYIWDFMNKSWRSLNECGEEQYGEIYYFEQGGWFLWGVLLFYLEDDFVFFWRFAVLFRRWFWRWFCFRLEVYYFGCFIPLEMRNATIFGAKAVFSLGHETIFTITKVSASGLIIKVPCPTINSAIDILCLVS